MILRRSRIALALERGNELAAESHELMREVRVELAAVRAEIARNRKEFREESARNREESARNRETHGDLRTFTRDLTRRNERVWGEVMEELRAGRQTLEELRDQVEANTRGLLAVLDRFENGGAAPA